MRKLFEVAACVAMIAAAAGCMPQPPTSTTTTSTSSTTTTSTSSTTTTSTTTTTEVQYECGRPGHAFGVVDSYAVVAVVFGGGEVLYDVKTKLTVLWDDEQGNITPVLPTDDCIGAWSRVIADVPNDDAQTGLPLDPFAPDDQLDTFGVLCGPNPVYIRAFPEGPGSPVPSPWVAVPIPCGTPD